MSNRTREINKITTTIIGISVKLMVYALIILLLYEAVARGYAFGHEIFFAEAVDEAPGQDMVVQIDSKESVSDAAQFLAHKGLIKSEFAFIFQSKFYDYDTIYPGTYTLNMSMTSKEILQLLNEKPETVQNRPSPAAPRQLKPRRPRAGHLRRKTGTAVLRTRRHLRLRQLRPRTVQPQRQRQTGKYRLTRLLGPGQGRMPLTPRRPRPMSRPMKARTRRWKADGLRTRQRMEPNDCK